MAILGFEGGEMHYKSIEETINELQDSLKHLSLEFRVVADLNLQKIFHELMENYVKMKAPKPVYNGNARNEFIQLAVKTLNKLYQNEVFQDDYKVEYKKIEEK